MSFITSAYVLAAFLFLFGFAYLWVSGQTSRVVGPGKITPHINLALTLLGYLYLSLSFLSVYVAAGNTLYLENEAPCENIVVNSTYNFASNITTYAYEDSCAAREIPVANERLFVVLSWVLFLNLVLAVLGLFIVIVKWMWPW